MTDFRPLLYSTGFLLILGIIMPFILGFFIEIDEIQISPLANSSTQLIDQGFELDVIPFTNFGSFNINPFSWLGSGLQRALKESMIYLGLIPDFIVVGILIIIVLSLIYTVLSFIRGN